MFHVKHLRTIPRIVIRGIATLVDGKAFHIVEKLEPEVRRLYRPIPRPVMWSAGYDYVRLTTKPGDGSEYRAAQLEEAAYRAAVRAQGGQAIDRAVWSSLGYRGWIAGKIAFGTSGQGAMLQASGYAAEFVAAECPGWDNVARLDVHVTHWYETDEHWIVDAVERRSREYAAVQGARKHKVRKEDSGDDGKTVYIGARTSPIFIRTYEKGKERKGAEDYANAIRHEIELKNGFGSDYWPKPGRVVPSRESLAALVYSVYKKRGVFLPKTKDAGYFEVPVPKEDASASDRLAWYRAQVAPSIKKAKLQGYSVPAILEALGIDLFLYPWQD